MKFTTHQHLRTFGSYNASYLRPHTLSSRYTRLQEISTICSLARRVVAQAHQNHGSNTVIPLWGGSSVAVNMERDLFHIELLLYDLIPSFSPVDQGRRRNRRIDLLLGLVRIPTPIPDCDRLIGIRRLTIPACVIKREHDDCKRWSFTPTQFQYKTLPLGDEDGSDMEPDENYQPNNYRDGFQCTNCQRTVDQHYDIARSDEYSILAAAWFPSLERVYVVVHGDVPAPGPLNSNDIPYRIVPEPTCGTNLLRRHHHIDALALYRTPGKRTIPRWCRREPVESFACVGGSLVEFWGSFEFLIHLSASVVSPFANMLLINDHTDPVRQA
ncbi:hypothetical protein QBC41DRAFT_325170 [Cercophora samala]|uniref:Uncharacterized protein n=1 Tax=Cercophora samala TaxID=330535 RepID=A0AA39ZAI8_9PEZI|nr:hypothetical protein QBC41DRAFT_325170 [Cercophora samala]